MDELKLAKRELQDAILDLVAKFENKFDVSVAHITLLKSWRLGESPDKTHNIEVKVEV